MNEPSFRMLYFTIMNVCIFGALYLYGYKAHPKLAAWLCIGTCVVMITACYFSGSFIAVSLILPVFFLIILKKPGESLAFQQFYTQHNIFSTKNFSQAALDKLGNKNWIFAEGTMQKSITQKITYGFWQGHTTSTVSTGKYGTTTSYTYYLAFVFPPGSVSEIFKQIATASADRSHYTFRQKLKFFFMLDTETPSLVTTAADGSFIIQYTTMLDVAHYTRRVNWLQENIGRMYFPLSSLQMAVNPN